VNQQVKGPMKISILTPSRGRPEMAARFASSVIDTAYIPEDIELLFYVDNDDPRLSAYADWHLICPGNVKVIIGEPMRTSMSWNILAKQCTGDILIMGNDDMMYRTEGWDHILLKRIAQFKNGIYVAYFDDGINGESHAAFPIVSRLWYETLGYFTRESFHFLYTDTWISDIGKKLDRMCFIPEVMCEHLHFTTGKMQADETTMRPRRGNAKEQDKDLYEGTDQIRQREADKLRKRMFNTGDDLIGPNGSKYVVEVVDSPYLVATSVDKPLKHFRVHFDNIENYTFE